MSTFASYPPSSGGGSSNGITKYATFASFPSASSAGNGAFAVALDTNIVYESNGTSWLVVSTPPFSSGNLTDVGTDGITITNGSGAVLGSGTSIAQQKSDATHNGYLSSTDWSSFNSKQPAGNYITALTGDVTASGPGSATATLATVNPSPGTYNRANITVNDKGLVTAAFASSTGSIIASGSAGLSVTGGTNAALSAVSISQQPAAGSQNGYLTSTDWTTFNNKQTAGNYITALTGDITASGPGSAAATLATVNANVGSFNPAVITVNAKGLITAAASATTGNLSGNSSAGLSVSGGTLAVLGTGATISQTQADASNSGYLSTTDWNTFNNKASVPTSQVRSDTGNGHGSTNTRVRRFTNNTTTGSAITVTSNATVGNTYTINEAGIYAISYSDYSSNNSNFGIGINASGTTNVESLAAANRLAIQFAANTSTRGNVSGTVRLAVNDVITPQDDSNVNGTDNTVQFTITQVARL